MLQLKVTPVVGLPQFTGWSQVAESTVSVSARLVVVYAVSGKHAGSVGRDINEKISEFYFYDAAGLHEFLQQLVAYSHENDCKIYFACCVLSRTASVFATYGGSVFLKRSEKSGRILVSETEIKIVAGRFLPEDTFVLTTLQADQFLSEIQLKFQQGYDTDIIITSIVPGLHQQDDSSLSAIVFIAQDLDQATTQATREPDFEISHSPSHSHSDSQQQEQQYQQQQTEPKSSQESNNSGFDAQLSVEVDPLDPTLNKKIEKLKKLGIFIVRQLKKLLSLLLLVLQYCARSLVSLVKYTARLPKMWSDNKVYMHSQSGKRAVWKFVAIVAVVIVGLIIIGVISYSAAQEKERISFALVPVQEQVSLAQELLETDPITTREMITQALASLATLEKENQESNAVSLIVEEKQRLTTYLESISATSQLQELEVFYDLRLAKSDFIASGADISGNTLVVYDADMRQVLLLDHDSQQVALKDLSNTPVLKAVSAHLDSVFVLTDGIYSFPLALAQPQLQDSPEDPQQSPGQNTTSNELSEVRSPGDSNTSATLLDAYDRFVYIVNPEKRNIYRYAQTEDGYSEPVGWMKAATGLAYETLLSLSVDGSVWLTTNQGQIKKFVLGREEQFEIRGLDQAFDSEIYLYTNEKLNNLYVLDPNNSRVVVLDKNGNFVKQVESVSLGAANAITVSEELGKMFIVGGPILYQVTL